MPKVRIHAPCDRTVPRNGSRGGDVYIPGGREGIDKSERGTVNLIHAGGDLQPLAYLFVAGEGQLPGASHRHAVELQVSVDVNQTGLRKGECAIASSDPIAGDGKAETVKAACKLIANVVCSGRDQVSDGDVQGAGQRSADRVGIKPFM